MKATNRSAEAEIEQMQQLLLAANNKFAQGDATQLKELCSHRDDVTLFGGAGGYERGWEQVGPRYSWASANFSGGQMTSQVLATHVSADLACTVELERWDVRLASTGAAATIELRVTHVYRREEGSWKVIHRHAEHLVPKGDMAAIIEKSAGAVTVAAILAEQLSTLKTAQAAPAATSKAAATQLRPIDKLVVDIAIDNVSDSYSSKPPQVSPEFNNVIEAGAKEISGLTLCCAQLGLALVLTAYAGNRHYKLLFDAGPEGALFLRNCRNLGVPLPDVEEIAISHGHWDHMGALLDAVGYIAQTNKDRKIPCHVNPGMFLERGAKLTTGQIAPFQKVPSPEELAAHGAQVVNSGEPRLLLDDCFYLSGEIPRVSSFEKGRPDHLCRRSADKPWEPDPLIMDERYLAVNVRAKGLIVFSSCSHAGIVNVLLNARKVFPEVSLYGVLGGLHLAGEAMERLIPDTVEHLKQFDLKQIMPGHCTGWRALYALLNEFGESVVTPSAVGSRFTF
ncbi:MAG: nuclear transport factor 2 family protein [Chromatiales bacterium]